MHQWCRHGRRWSTSSFEQAVRQMLGEPSIDCIEARARLKYWRRVMTSGPSMLRPLTWNMGRLTQWALQVRKDLEALASQVSGYLTVEEMMRSGYTVVRKLFWDTSCVNLVRHVETITSSSITCTECIGTTGEMRQFMSVKALLCHQRMKHGFRNPMLFFADDGGVCSACGTNFRTRLRLLDHLSDARRTHCRDVCNGGTVTKLSNERVGDLNELDKGCSHCCETEWAFACACTVASLENEWTRWELQS